MLGYGPRTSRGHGGHEGEFAILPLASDDPYFAVCQVDRFGEIPVKDHEILIRGDVVEDFAVEVEDLDEIPNNKCGYTLRR